MIFFLRMTNSRSAKRQCRNITPPQIGEPLIEQAFGKALLNVLWNL